VIERVRKEGVKKARLEIFEVILRLRQLAIHPDLFPAFSGGEGLPSGKLELLLEDIEGIVEGNEKALIYSQFTSFLHLIKKELDQRGIPYAYLDGATVDRKGAVEKFQNNADIPLFLMSLKAGGVGLNLTEADYVFLMDPWWNIAAEEQAIGRSHRMGREKPVIAKRYISRETIEEKMLKIKKMKKELATGLFDEEGSITDFDIDMIEELF
jgi:SNF2 family DNA or RNA helicase